ALARPPPPPVPPLTPRLAGARGKLSPDPGLPYVMTEPGIDIVGRVVARDGRWTVFRVTPPLRLAHAAVGISTDDWMGSDSGYSQFATPGGRRGYVVVSISRLGWRGASKPAPVVIRLRTVV